MLAPARPLIESSAQGMRALPDPREAPDEVRDAVLASSRVVPYVELRAITINRCHAEVLQYGVTDPLEVQVSTSGRWGVTDDRDQFQAEVSVDLQSGTTPENPAWTISVSLLLTYAVEPDAKIEPAAFDAYAGTGAVFTAWPYAREVVQSLTNRMGFPPLVLPLLKTPLDVIAFSRSSEPQETLMPLPPVPTFQRT